jgi:hypothetical protein
MQSLPPALAFLAHYRQFLCYVLVPSQTKAGKMDKLPVSPLTASVVSAHAPEHWVDAQTACNAATAWGPSYGVAFSLQKGNGLFFVDLDSHLGPSGWSPLAQQICGLFPGAALELSQSRKGLHIIGRGVAPEHGCKRDDLGLEFYTEGRFIALTGLQASGDAGTDHTGALATITQHLFPPGAGKHNGAFVLTAEPVPEWRGPTDDAELIRRALNSRSAGAAFGVRASFADLWQANVEVLRVAYPSADKLYGGSEADAALAAHLAFWTGKHGERIEQLMRQSALKRDKWDRHGDDYLARTICEVIARGGDVLQDKPPEPPSLPMPAAEAPSQRAVEGQTFLGADAQRDLFKGCVYVQDRHRVLVPGGNLLKPEQFRVAFGGYVFAMDDINQRTSRNSWEAFTESQILRAPMADTICFRPQDPPGSIHMDAGRARVNTWWPANVRRTVGDLSPFTTHLSKLLPNEDDRALLLAYMAACVQHKGVKFNWWPVIQGCEGNGKTLLSLCVAMAVGQHYTHWPKAADLLSPFNAWLANKVFVGLEELQAADAHTQTEVIEQLKTIITGSMGIQIQAKGVDQVSTEIVANGMATTNYKTAVRKTPDNARRFAMFFTAQQSYADLERDGMTGDYFPTLYGWLKHRDGFAIVSELLHTYPIPDELNPAVALHRAPRTSTTDDAVTESRGNVEQAIMEAVAQGVPGFCGGWVSSLSLERLLEDMNVATRIPHSKRRQIMTDLGYMLHPGLTDGRVNNPVQPDGRKVQLYVVRQSPIASMQGPAEIAKAYTAAQSSTAQGVRA